MDVSQQILIIDDSKPDFELLKRAFGKSELDVSLIRCHDGLQALHFLYKEGEYCNLPESAPPSVILLDLNMPGMDGYTFLETIKDDNDFKHIPIIVLSVSDNPDDVMRSYQLGASSYIKKPSGIEENSSMVKSINEYWFSHCSLPRHP